jgi:cyclophilin family peptidyl-prolyl cis-trans isomerase
MSRILVVVLLVGSIQLASLGQVTAAAQDAANDVEQAVAGEAGAQQAAADQTAVEQQPADPPANDGQQTAAPTASPEAVAANEAFEKLVEEWNTAIADLKGLQQRRDAAQGQARTDLEAQMAEMRKKTNDIIDRLTDAGLTAYKLDKAAFPRVNVTLRAIARFHVIGDAQGDGGDQYEKAFALTKALIDAGAAEEMKELYLLGGMSAYCIGELDLAADYLTKASDAGMFANIPQPTPDDPPPVKLVRDSAMYLADMDAQRGRWAAEQKIRAAEAEADDMPRVKFTTTKGDIVIELFENEAPQTVANFITLVKSGYYDGIVFHRVLPLFMAQGGDPSGSGSGGPGYSIRDENGLPKQRRHFRGSLSMANAGPNTGGSQFFLTFVPTTYLDGRHAVFGRVIEGIDVAASLRRRNPDPNIRGPKPIPDKILKAEVLRDRGHEYTFEKLPE